jgi:hypothetical protein
MSVGQPRPLPARRHATVSGARVASKLSVTADSGVALAVGASGRAAARQACRHPYPARHGFSDGTGKISRRDQTRAQIVEIMDSSKAE